MSGIANEKNDARDRVRTLVRQILDSVPDDVSVHQDRVADAGKTPEHIIVNSLKDQAEREFDKDESSKGLLTEDDLRGLDDGARLRVADGVKFTSLAADIIKERNIQLVTKAARKSTSKVISAAIGSDHGGFRVKEQVRSYLESIGIHVRDFGTNSEDAVDYPDFAHAVAAAVSGGNVDIGLLIDGAGIGSAMTANKVPNVRAAACYSPALAKNSREHNGANVLTLGAGQNSIEEIKKIIDAFISTEITEERHKKRVAKINNIEKQYRQG